jgi:hypothetical protein
VLVAQHQMPAGLPDRGGKRGFRQRTGSDCLVQTKTQAHRADGQPQGRVEMTAQELTGCQFGEQVDMPSIELRLTSHALGLLITQGGLGPIELRLTSGALGFLITQGGFGAIELRLT